MMALAPPSSLRPPAEPLVGPDGQASTAWLAFLQAIADRLTVADTSSGASEDAAAAAAAAQTAATAAQTAAETAAGQASAAALAASLSPPIGALVPFAHPDPVPGYVPALGQTLFISQYPAAAAVLGNYYGGNGTTTFGVPAVPGSSLGPDLWWHLKVGPS